MRISECVGHFPVEAARLAALRSDVIDAVRLLYSELDAEIAARSPTCWNKGECCRFGEYGHRLFVTTIEVAYYLSFVCEPVASIPAPATRSLPILPASAASADVCPHAYGGTCHAREQRPLGCRIFYCDPAAQSWQGPMTERYLAKLRTLHEQFEVPYVYADWMAFLAAIDAANPASR
jgi:hypothetical protein